jgi:hypothetical protein
LKLVWFGHIKSQIKGEGQFESLGYMPALLALLLANGLWGLQSVCPSGGLLSTCFPLEQGNGLLKILHSMPRTSPDPNAVWHDTMRLEGRGQDLGLQLAPGACPVQGLPQSPSMCLALRTQPTWLPHTPGSVPKSFTLVSPPDTVTEKAFLRQWAYSTLPVRRWLILGIRESHCFLCGSFVSGCVHTSR